MDVLVNMLSIEDQKRNGAKTDFLFKPGFPIFTSRRPFSFFFFAVSSFAHVVLPPKIPICLLHHPFESSQVALFNVLFCLLSRCLANSHFLYRSFTFFRLSTI